MATLAWIFNSHENSSTHMATTIICIITVQKRLFEHNIKINSGYNWDKLHANKYLNKFTIWMCVYVYMCEEIEINKDGLKFLSSFNYCFVFVSEKKNLISSGCRFEILNIEWVLSVDKVNTIEWFVASDKKNKREPTTSIEFDLILQLPTGCNLIYRSNCCSCCCMLFGTYFQVGLFLLFNWPSSSSSSSSAPYE